MVMIGPTAPKLAELLEDLTSKALWLAQIVDLPKDRSNQRQVPGFGWKRWVEFREYRLKDTQRLFRYFQMLLAKPENTFLLGNPYP